MIDKEYLEKMKRLNDLPINQVALKFLREMSREPVSVMLPYAAQVIMELEQERKIQPHLETREYLTEVLSLDDPEEMIEPMGLKEEFHLWPKKKQTPKNLAFHVLESIQNEMIEKNLL